MPDVTWFQLEGDELGACINEMVTGFRRNQAGRRAQYVRNLELYERQVMGGYTAHSYGITADHSRIFDDDRLGLVRSACETAVANIYAPQKPKPQFQTLGATWATRRKAYKLDRICEGILNQRQEEFINVWALMTDAGADAVLQGVCPVRVDADKKRKRIMHTICPIVDIFTDPAEGRRPRSFFQRSPIDVPQAERTWPKMASSFRDAPDYDWYGTAIASRPRASKVIELQYAWRVADGPDEPGFWALCCNGKVLESGEWLSPVPPFVFLFWERHRCGPWGSGIGVTAGEQARECSELDKRLYHRELIASKKRTYYHRDSLKPDDLALNEAETMVAIEPGAVFPQDSLTVAFSPLELQYRDAKIRDFWDAIGISQVSAAARREQGIDSGIALQTLNDTKSGRQLVKAQRYEQAFVDLAYQYVWRLRELAAEDPDFSVQWTGKALVRQIKWADADTEDDMFSVSVAPASALPHDPAGRQQMVDSLFRSGLISQETAKSLIGWPDLESELNVENSEYEYIDMLIEKYLDADEETWSAADYQAPEGFIANKFGALRRFAAAWFRARIDQQFLPDDEKLKAEFSISLIQRYIQEMDALMTPPAPPPAPPGSAPTPDQLAPVQGAQSPALPPQQPPIAA